MLAALYVLHASLPVPAFEGSSYRAVSDAVFGDPYASRPTYRVDPGAFGPEGDRADNHLRAAARRTLTERDDLHDFPGGQKLLQPNGICFAAEWRITEASPYSGLLARGARGLAIARASVALGATDRGHKRAFALAIKLFPTLDADAVVRTVNLFVMETIAGTLHPHFLDATLDNHPEWGGLPAFGDWGLGLRIRRDLSAVDGALSPNGPDLTYRPLDALVGIEPGIDAKRAAPKWLRLRIAPGTPRIDAADFRDELALAHYPSGKLVWQIDVAADAQRGKPAAEWHPLGTLTLTRSVTSRTCDTRLHFAHPRLG